MVVPVRYSPGGIATGSVTEKLAIPLALVVTVVDPMKTRPSAEPWESSAAFEKNWIVKVLFAVLLSVPWTIVVLPELTAELITGALWFPLAEGFKLIPRLPLL